MTGHRRAGRMLGTAVLAAASVGVVGCGASVGGNGAVSAGNGTTHPGPSSSSSASTSPSRQPGALLSSGASGGPRVLPHSVVVQGRVVAGVEAGCRLLVSGGTQYLLVGAPAVPEAGTVVRVTGHTVERLPSYCMQGTPLHVDSLRVLSLRSP